MLLHQAHMGDMYNRNVCYMYKENYAGRALPKQATNYANMELPCSLRGSTRHLCASTFHCGNVPGSGGWAEKNYKLES